MGLAETPGPAVPFLHSAHRWPSVPMYMTSKTLALDDAGQVAGALGFSVVGLGGASVLR